MSFVNSLSFLRGQYTNESRSFVVVSRDPLLTVDDLLNRISCFGELEAIRMDAWRSSSMLHLSFYSYSAAKNCMVSLKQDLRDGVELIKTMEAIHPVMDAIVSQSPKKSIKYSMKGFVSVFSDVGFVLDMQFFLAHLALMNSKPDIVKNCGNNTYLLRFDDIRDSDTLILSSTCNEIHFEYELMPDEDAVLGVFLFTFFGTNTLNDRLSKSFADTKTSCEETEITDLLSLREKPEMRERDAPIKSVAIPKTPPFIDFNTFNLVERDENVREVQMSMEENAFKLCERMDFNFNAARTDSLTLMLRNLPIKYSVQQLIKDLDISFRGAYDFVYVPRDIKTGRGLGYAFVNLKSSADFPRFSERFTGRTWAFSQSKKRCEVTTSKLQGLEKIKAKFNRPFYMSCPVEHRPVFLD